MHTWNADASAEAHAIRVVHRHDACWRRRKVQPWRLLLQAPRAGRYSCIVGVNAKWGALPRFDKPPVVEVAVGLSFVPIPQLGVVELVQLHQGWQDRYPKVVEQLPIPPSAPPDGSVLAGTGLTIGTGVGPVRLWMLTPDEHILLQVQHDRLILNWRALAGGRYPSYDEMRAEFLARWSELVSAVEDLGPVHAGAAEVTFVNLIKAPGGDGELAPVLISAGEVRLPEMVSLGSSQAQYIGSVELEGKPVGQLAVTAARARGTDVTLTVVARVNLPANVRTTDQITDALDTAHAVAVLGFAEITTPEMHTAWGRTS